MMDFDPLKNEQIELLKRLCHASGVSGAEGEVRKIVLEQVRPGIEQRGGSVRVDALGNVLVHLPGTGSEDMRLKVMVAAHMDEVGVMVSGADGEGLFRFEAVGGLDQRQLVGKPVWVGKEHLPGVIGAKPVHLTTMEERKSPLSLDALRIDIGTSKGNKIKVAQ